MDLDERLPLRDLRLGDDERRDQLLTAATPDESVGLLVEEIAPALAQLGRIVDERLPLETPEEAVEYALTRERL